MTSENTGKSFSSATALVILFFTLILYAFRISLPNAIGFGIGPSSYQKTCWCRHNRLGFLRPAETKPSARGTPPLLCFTRKGLFPDARTPTNTSPSWGECDEWSPHFGSKRKLSISILAGNISIITSAIRETTPILMPTTRWTKGAYTHGNTPSPCFFCLIEIGMYYDFHSGQARPGWPLVALYLVYMIPVRVIRVHSGSCTGTKVSYRDDSSIT